MNSAENTMKQHSQTELDDTVKVDKLKSIQISILGLSIDIPVVLITRNMISIIALILSVVALYFVHANHRLDRGIFNNGGSGINFKSTYVFWVPEFSKKNLVVDSPKEREGFFNDFITKKFGGFTRWHVQGSSGNSVDSGWFYQTSLPDTHEIDYKEIEGIIDKIFLDDASSLYLVEYSH